MPDDIFSVFPAPDDAAPGSAEVIYLRRALFVIHGRYFDPIAQADKPLPPHRWAIAHSEAAFAEGTTSDGDGISTIFEPDTTGVPAEAEWDLFLVPIFAGRSDSDAYAERREAWFDIEAGTWIPPDEFPGESRYRILATRKLLRVPLWSSKRMVATGGSFVGTFPHSGTFATTGVLQTSELRPHGTRESPWVMQIDQGWMRTHIRLRCYDPIAKADRDIGQGPLLTARNGFGGDTLGGSSIVQPGGATYMVLAGTQDRMPQLDYQFQTPRHSWFAYRDGAAETTATTPPFDLTRFGTHYLLPDDWGSLGQDAWVGTANPTASARKPFADVRHRGTAVDQPLSFHLDDLVLTGEDNERALGQQIDRTIVLPSDRVALLDCTMALRDPDTNGHGTVPYSRLRLTKFPMRAEEAMFVAGQGFEAMTRAVDYEGRLFSVAEHRVGGILGFDPLVGARAGKVLRASTGPAVTGVGQSNYEAHLLDTRWVRSAYRGVSARLAHLVIYVPAFVTAPTVDDMPGGINAARTIGVPVAEHLLFTAAQIWDQTHPSNPTRAPPSKEYAIISAAGLTAERTIVRTRHHFGARKNAGRVDVRPPPVTPPLVPLLPETKLTIEVHPQAGRATGGDPMHLYLVFGLTLNAPPVNPHPAAPRPYSFEPAGGSMSDRIDLVPGQANTIAHELGHSMGLPDEYVEGVRPGAGADGDLPQFDSRLRPFNLDNGAMMRNNRIPRLRYAWQRVRNVAAIANALPTTHWSRTEAPFMAQYVAGSTTLRYALPTDVGPFATDPETWTPQRGSVGRCETALFMVGDDESTRGPVITPPTSGLRSDHFDGIVVVSPKLWFSFGPSVASLSDRWELMYDDFGRVYSTREQTPQFFIAAPSGATRMLRILILVQPRFEYGPNPSPLSATTVAQRSSADIEVNVQNGSAARLLTPGSPDVLRIRQGDVGQFLMRYALAPSAAVFNARVNTPLTATDLAPVAAWVGTTLSRGAGTVTPI